MTQVRLGVIGVGNMGSYHLRNIDQCPDISLAAVCDILPKRVALARKNHGGAGFTDHRALVASGLCDAVLIVTPHYAHTPIGIAALDAGLHVLVEKPVSVHKADCLRLIAAHRRRKQVFAAMLNQRTHPQFQALHRMIAGGALGRLQRVVWTVTNWYRTNAYYRSSPWRATWGGEGGGVLMNQAAHQLDLLYWLFGLPARVTAFCGFGKFHPIEVEDDVTAYLEFTNGATGVFIASTGDAPGTNRLDVTGDLGSAVLENGAMVVTRNSMSARTMSTTAKDCYAVPQHSRNELPAAGDGGQHMEILRNFIAAITKGATLIAPAREGIHAVELGNAMIMSALSGTPVDLPLDAAKYERLLKKLVAASASRSKRPRQAAPRMQWMFGR